MILARLKGLIMADDAPTPEQMVPSLLHAFMWASAFGVVEELRASRLWSSGGLLVAALTFHIVGIKWPQIKPYISPRFVSALERIANNRLYRWGIYALILSALLASAGIAIYRHYHRSAIAVAPPALPSSTIPPPDDVEINLNVLEGWDSSNRGCRNLVETGQLVKYTKDYLIYTACGLVDPTKDMVNTTVVVSSPFSISGQSQEMDIVYPKDSPPRKGIPRRNMTFHVVFLLPKGIDASVIEKIQDVKTNHGKIITPGTGSPVESPKRIEPSPKRDAKPETTPPPAHTSTHRLVEDGNIIENQPNKLEVQDPGTTFTNNTVRGMDATVSHGAYADNNDFEGRGEPGKPSQSDGKGADMVKLWAAQTANVYKCRGPCGAGPFPDDPIEGVPSNLPFAKALHDSSRFVADQLSSLIDEGNVILYTFLVAGSDMEALKKNEIAWQAKIKTVVSNLDPRLGEALTHVRSMRYSNSNRNPEGIKICESIAGKIDLLTIYQNQLRGVGD